MVFQKPEPFPMSIYENVAFGDTDSIFGRPRCKETEDYVSGRFG